MIDEIESILAAQGLIETGLTERLWTEMLTNFSLPFVTIAISALLHVIFFLLAAGLPFLFQFIPFFAKYKIQPEKEYTVTQQAECLWSVLLSQLLVQTPMLVGNYFFMTKLSIPLHYHEIPPWWDAAWRLLVCMVIEDTWHYFAHRALHDKRIYKYVHKLHHVYTAPFGFATEYAHPVEVVVLGMGFFWGLILLCNHMLFMWLWMITRLGISIDQHSGYDFPWNPLYLIPGYSGARHHDWHHEKFSSNFASTFVWWDRVFKTDVDYRQHLREMKQMKVDSIAKKDR